ncbi:TetR/AcrR family transcriptional regulator [Alloalcanivorax gelatiniphagus]|mgnify:CR=1 FL=1|uniref:TetR/AcrR family transcriptional regulator n=1 Tax=Alloalcanivorax gelatiniphagus TaxID=1194167 RepID=A0ABY2XKR1_9GAMM|nr:TetR/AcrR family transcriptional regulator [Alloalcanivorax gelatiniphagus]TMW12662.1 TetR/AcrR family transcriptional regulator [Alloalcanivorax gelatiniphagus]|tara:strand:- start:421 stop:1023 length:603 start_codon:yes stop_codon:yes gene_type:complete
MPRPARYHHGDLRDTLLREAAILLREHGVQGLSLRRLAERAGVSRTAPYHHFTDKNALLCALAEQGFLRLDRLIDGMSLDPADPEPGLRQFVRDYLRFAAEDPERYELMFGRTLWKAGRPDPALTRVAHDCFRRYVEAVRPERLGSLGQGADPLRVAQASWATLHGLCRLLLDGIYLRREDMEAVSDQAVTLMLAGLRRD